MSSQVTPAKNRSIALLLWVGIFCTSLPCASASAQNSVQPEVVGDTANGAASAAPLDRFLYAAVAIKGADVFTPHPADPLEGTIEEFDDQRIVFTHGDKRRELPSQRVMQVEPVWRTPAAAAAHRLFTERRYREAKEAITKAANPDLPRWQQRLLVAEIVDVLAALGDFRLAGEVFLASLAPHQPPAMLYAQLPLNWTTAEPDRALYEAALAWLEREDEPAQLLGASWLLLGTDRDAAKARLLKLQGSKREPIATLAVAQAWRLVPPTETEGKITEWFEARDRLLDPLQLGPTEFLADRLGRTGKIDLAIGQWSRVAALHADRPQRAATALNAARRLLVQHGRPEEAARFEAWLEQFKLQ